MNDSQPSGLPPWLKWLGITVLAAALIFTAWSFFSGSNGAPDTSLRWFVCAETKKPFQKHIEIGMTIPVLSPFSGKNTGFPAELCYWNKDGTIKTSDPTPVLLNSYINDNSPTFCPECGRLVIGHNPAPDPNRPPPTKEEWDARHAGYSTNY